MGGIFWCANVGWFRFKVSLMARTPKLSQNLQFNSIIEVTIDLQLFSHVGSSKTLIAQYQEPHAPIFAHTNHHFPHITVMCGIKVETVRNGLQIAIMKSYCIFNVFSRNSADITNRKHQFLHTITTCLTQPCRATTHGHGYACWQSCGWNWPWEWIFWAE